MRWISISAVVAALALAPAAHAVDPPEPYQGWASQSQVATVAGSLQLDTTGAPCSMACSDGPGDEAIEPDGSMWIDSAAVYGPATVWMVPGVAGPFALFWELGHEFDWRYLNDDERREFADLWRSSTPWWDTFTALAEGREDGLEATFASDYAECALGGTPQGTVWVPGTSEPANPQRVCELINAIGERVGATMPALAPSVSAVTVTTPLRRSRHRRRRWRSGRAATLAGIHPEQRAALTTCTCLP